MQEGTKFNATTSQEKNGFDDVLKVDLAELAEVCISGLLVLESAHRQVLNVRGPDARSIANLLFEVSTHFL